MPARGNDPRGAPWTQRCREQRTRSAEPWTFTSRSAARAFVQRIDVLGDEKEPPAARHLPALDGGERAMGGVRLLVQHDVEVARVPRPASGRILLEVPVGAELGDVALPHRPGVGAAEGRDAARETHARTGDDDEIAGAHIVEGGGEGCTGVGVVHGYRAGSGSQGLSGSSVPRFPHPIRARRIVQFRGARRRSAVTSPPGGRDQSIPAPSASRAGERG